MVAVLSKLALGGRDGRGSDVELVLFSVALICSSIFLASPVSPVRASCSLPMIKIGSLIFLERNPRRDGMGARRRT